MSVSEFLGEYLLRVFNHPGKEKCPFDLLLRNETVDLMYKIQSNQIRSKTEREPKRKKKKEGKKLSCFVIRRPPLIRLLPVRVLLLLLTAYPLWPASERDEFII